MRLFRLVVAIAGMPLAAILVAAGPLGTQSASATPTALVKCRSMQSETNSSSAPITLSGCDRPRVTGGTGTWAPPGPLTWSTGKETKFTITSETSFGPGRCRSAPIEVDAVGTIVSVSGPWTKRFLGDTVTFDACLVPVGPDPVGVATEGLVPGTFFTISRP
jgi:hypothetical protein